MKKQISFVLAGLFLLINACTTVHVHNNPGKKHGHHKHAKHGHHKHAKKEHTEVKIKPGKEIKIKTK
jgi:hypothetical protein